METFSVPVGRTRRITANPVDDSNSPQPITSNVTYTSSDPSIATAIDNAGAPQQTQVDVAGLIAGTAVITASALDAQSPPQLFSSTFTVAIEPATAPHATKFNFVDEGLL